MSANFQFANPPHIRRKLLKGWFQAFLGLIALVALTPAAHADDEAAVEKAVLSLAQKHEKDGYDFRADIWVRELSPDIGKAVRVQFYKGNEYRVCLAVPPKSGVEIAAHVLGLDGKPIESKIETVPGSWGLVLHVTPKKTGVYMITLRRSGGADKPTFCAMISGYK